MNPILKVLDVIPSWVYAAAIAALVIGGGSAIAVQTVRLADAKTEIAKLGEQAQRDRADRAQLVADHNLKIAGMQKAHAERQQEIINGFIDLRLRDQADHARELSRSRSVRDAAVAAAARDRATAEANGAAAGDLADRITTLYDLVARGHELVVRGREIVRRRDAEVLALKRIIQNDRTAVCKSTD
jgi:hypothetical protein